MQIVVNARHLVPGRLDGIGRFSYETSRRITIEHPDVRFVLVFDRDPPEEYVFPGNVTPVVLRPRADHPVSYHLWNHVRMKSLLRRLEPDLYLSPDGMIPLHAPCKTLAVIHDLNFAHNPGDVPFLFSKYYNFFYPQYAAQATRLATVSEYSREDLMRSYRMPAEKIDVVYNGVNDTFHALPLDERHEIRAQHANGKGYFVFVGSLHTRKNIIRLLQAFEQFKRSSGSDLKLMLVGAILWGRTEVRAQLRRMRSAEDVMFMGRVPDDRLNELLNGALALSYIPYFEGFGIPLVEAMKCEIPIICSDVTSMPEVVGDAAVLVDPFDVDRVAAAMAIVASDGQLRRRLVEKGRTQVQRFSWDASAQRLWESIEKTLQAQ